MKKETVKAVCTSCGGTGLYCGMCEKEGYPVVCIRCNGTGCELLQYEPFVKIRRKKNVKGVSLSRGTFLATGVGAATNFVSYNEFLAGKIKYRDWR